MAHDLKELSNATKRLTIIPGWAEIDSEFLQIVAPIEIEGVTIEGLQFRACARKRLPDEMITCQVEYHPNGEAGGPLARLEWRPIKSFDANLIVSSRRHGERCWHHVSVHLIGCLIGTGTISARSSAEAWTG
jgi:hypothetical protein